MSLSGSEKYNSVGRNLLLPRAYFASEVRSFLATSSDTILGTLTRNSEFPVDQPQRSAWLGEIDILRAQLPGLEGSIFLEFNIPRMGRRIDAVLISSSLVFVLEFKVGAKEFLRQDYDQVWDYALDLKNFHKGSHELEIIPILIATDAKSSIPEKLSFSADGVSVPVNSGSAQLRTIIDLGLRQSTDRLLDVEEWYAAPYQPTPTIIEAAQTLYAQHTVDAIARSDAGARNLRHTSRRLEELIDQARAEHRKAICFVTGVPGSGKTLVGLNVATQRRTKESPTHAVFLSGNAPLVAVLREALTRDEVERRRKLDEKVRKGKVAESIKAFIQNVHHFRDEGLRNSGPPVDHVVIFDEAQRAWDLPKTETFMRTKKKQHGFAKSEPEFLISYLDRHQDWAVIVCLVGGGQEIHKGEAGIGAWIEATRDAFPGWDIYISSELSDSEYAAGKALESVASRDRVTLDRDLHLSVSMRSFRAENVSRFVKAVLDCELENARSVLTELVTRFPIVLSRDLGKAKAWVRRQARGSERYGLVASSKAHRLKPHAIDVRVDVDPVNWFLADRQDTRSSYYLEDAATEFQVQGLELDWVCITWDGDLRFSGDGWDYNAFKGSKWERIKQPERQNYLRNAYRVLMTRARQGMVIFVPPGDSSDPTRNPRYYDPTFNYLAELGIPILA